jgi:hypothetical protein
MAQVHHTFEERNRFPSSVAGNIRKVRMRSAAIPAVRVELLGGNRATALGVEVRGPSPVLALCRALVEAGQDPTTPLLVYRSNALALKVRSIGEGARLTVKDNHIGKPVFRRWRHSPESGAAAPPIAPNALAGTGHRVMPEALP